MFLQHFFFLTWNELIKPVPGRRPYIDSVRTVRKSNLSDNCNQIKAQVYAFKKGNMFLGEAFLFEINGSL